MGNQADIHFKDNGKLKLLIIVGTRPEIIRLSAVITKCRKATATNKKTEIAQSVNINQREAKKKEKCCK